MCEQGQGRASPGHSGEDVARAQRVAPRVENGTLSIAQPRGRRKIRPRYAIRLRPRAKSNRQAIGHEAVLPISEIAVAIVGDGWDRRAGAPRSPSVYQAAA